MRHYHRYHLWLWHGTHNLPINIWRDQYLFWSALGLVMFAVAIGVVYWVRHPRGATALWDVIRETRWQAR